VSIFPDLSKSTIEFPFGDVCQRPRLDLNSRELATVAALTDLGNFQPQSNVRIKGALSVGCKPEEIVGERIE